MTDSEKEKAQLLIAEARRAFDASLERARAALGAGSLLAGAVWAQVSADLAFHKHPGIFCSPELEALLVEIAGKLENGGVRAPQGTPKAPRCGKPRMLHVMTNAYSTGGHTRLVQRLAVNSSGSHDHFLVTTAQRGELPERMKGVFCADSCDWLDLSTPGSDLLSRSLRLRQISREAADVVFVHCHPFDIVPVLAFGVPGGPPVVILNHSDHTFWVGASVADAVADLRLVGQELTLGRRQVPLSRILPIPLVDAEPPAPQARSAARERLGIAEDAVVFLTIATPYKFAPVGGYDFLAAVSAIMQRHEKAVLLACGPKNAGAWKEASESVGGRIRAFGVQSDISDFQAAVDIYLDPFPLASLTSWLETALLSVSVIGMANTSAPIFSDGSIIQGDGWTHAASCEEYLEEASALIADAQWRMAQGSRIRAQIAARHLMPAWGKFLDELLQAVPSSHEVRDLEQYEERLDDTDFILAIMNHMTSGRRSVNTSLRKHGGCFPAKERCRLLLKGLFGIDGMRLLPLATYSGKELFS